MNGLKPERHQGDGKQEQFSDKAMSEMFDGLDTTDTTRQELAAETDVNNIVKSWGIYGGPGERQAKYGQEINYDIDMQSALEAIAQARQAFDRLPDRLKAVYPTWPELLAAIDAGAVTTKDFKEPEPEPPKPPEPSQT